MRKIVIGGTIGVAAILAAYFLFFRKREEEKDANQQQQDNKQPEKPAKIDVAKPVDVKPQEDALKDYINEHFGLRLKHPGYITAEKGENNLFYILKFYTQQGDCDTHLIIQPHENSSLDAFLQKAFDEVKQGLNIEVKDLNKKPFKIGTQDALELQYTYVYPSPINKVQKYWSVVVAMNNNIYLFQHFSADLKDLAMAKQIASSIQLSEAKYSGKFYVKSDMFQLELPSILYKQTPKRDNTSLLDYALLDASSDVVRQVKINHVQNIASLDALVQSQVDNHKQPASAFAFVDASIIGKSLQFSQSGRDVTNVCFSAKGKHYIASLQNKSVPEHQHSKQGALQNLANLKIISPPVKNEILVYHNAKYGFKIEMPAANITFFVEHMDDDPVITFLYSGILLETNVSCIVPETLVSSIQDVKDQIREGLTSVSEGDESHVVIKEETSVKIGKHDGVQFVYLHDVPYASSTSLKYVLTSLVHNGKVYHIRSYTCDDMWNSSVEEIIHSIHKSVELF